MEWKLRHLAKGGKQMEEEKGAYALRELLYGGGGQGHQRALTILFCCIFSKCKAWIGKLYAIFSLTSVQIGDSSSSSFVGN